LFSTWHVQDTPIHTTVPIKGPLFAKEAEQRPDVTSRRGILSTNRKNLEVARKWESMIDDCASVLRSPNAGFFASSAYTDVRYNAECEQGMTTEPRSSWSTG
jgi:hypothetical protein